MPESAAGPLHGMVVLDMTAVVLGPLATQILGDYGADVIKIEPPGGDSMRSNGTPRTPGLGSIFLALNRNKRSIALDLKRPEGQAVLRRLIARADALVHNMRPAAMARLGFGPEACLALNPRLVYAAAPGFGQDGPDRDLPAFDDVIQAACGLAALLSEGEAEPRYVPSLIADKTTGLMLANAVLAALLARERTGRGQAVEVPMLETMVAFLLAEHMGGLTYPGSGLPAGYHRVTRGGRRPMPTADGHIAILPYSAEDWFQLFDLVGRRAEAERLGVADRSRRNAHIQELYRLLAEITRTRTTAEWLAICRRLDIPAMRLIPLEELPDQPHLQAVGLFRESLHPHAGPIREIRPPVRFSATPAALRRPAPRLGEHGPEILAEAGFAPAEIAALAAAGVLITPPERMPA
ncbi:MAG: CoA transferase [Rhodovarius sp.]|nr:CoA transferase [Rhodovarius sp.]MDW8314702.1 CoA transferase [Rhodovarius sp.]